MSICNFILLAESQKLANGLKRTGVEGKKEEE